MPYVYGNKWLLICICNETLRANRHFAVFADHTRQVSCDYTTRREAPGKCSNKNLTIQKRLSRQLRAL